MKSLPVPPDDDRPGGQWDQEDHHVRSRRARNRVMRRSSTRAGDIVAANVAPRVREAPGFVSAIWMSDGSGGTLNVLTFTSEAAAASALEAARLAPRPPFLRLETAEVLRVLTSAAVRSRVTDRGRYSQGRASGPRRWPRSLPTMSFASAGPSPSTQRRTVRFALALDEPLAVVADVRARGRRTAAPGWSSCARRRGSAGRAARLPGRRARSPPGTTPSRARRRARRSGRRGTTGRAPRRRCRTPRPGRRAGPGRAPTRAAPRGRVSSICS